MSYELLIGRVINSIEMYSGRLFAYKGQIKVTAL